MKLGAIIAYLIAFSAVFTTSYIASIFTKNNVKTSWYECVKPWFTPPDAVFPIVWTILYILIAIALAQAIMLPNSASKYWLLGFYGYNLFQNILWPFYYFEQHETRTALFILIELMVNTSIILTQTYRLLPSWVGHILIPYLMWLGFAGVMNYFSIDKKC
jgi:translocator protein